MLSIDLALLNQLVVFTLTSDWADTVAFLYFSVLLVLSKHFLLVCLNMFELQIRLLGTTVLVLRIFTLLINR